MSFMSDFSKYFMEVLFLIIIVIGIAVALVIPSAVISYILIFLVGIYAGRLIYAKKTRIQLPYFMIIAGFVIGYLIGVYYGSRRIAIALFVVGAIIGYKLFENRLLKDTQDFRK